MILKNYKSLLFLFISVVVAYVVHQLVFYFFKIDQQTFYYSLEQLYGIFFILSFVIVFILLMIKKRNFDQLGMSFLLLTSSKLVFYYLLLKPILNRTHYDIRIEKINFFVLFVLFLTIETVLTIRILSKKP
ncbi:hypothetical protein BIW12_06390 [Flavobacterium commune]|uniref:Uncharacterized protein n=1 Tax=Flavobacterium commune TaxID=1306519 RepID=A0A1D9P976_9FLAO|nr:hypothetical protein BIW12_06390 [Flavobacterium commune]